MVAKSSTPSPIADTGAAPATTPVHVEEAKSRFNAAIDEAKAGATALKEEAVERAASYRDQAKGKGEHLSSDVKEKASELAVEGKAKASGALIGLGKLVDDNAPVIDEKFGPKYGDYARTASRSIQETGEKLDQKSLEELGEDAREFVRTKPAAAIGIAAAAGFLIARLFRK